MNKIRIKTGDYTKEELLEKMKELDKPLFKIIDGGDLYMLNQDREYEYVDCSNLGNKTLIENIRNIFEDILKTAGFELPTFEEIMDKDKALYSLCLSVNNNDNFYFESTSFKKAIYLKWWTEEAHDYIKKYVLTNEIFIKWFERKFRG